MCSVAQFADHTFGNRVALLLSDGLPIVASAGCFVGVGATFLSVLDVTLMLDGVLGCACPGRSAHESSCPWFEPVEQGTERVKKEIVNIEKVKSKTAFKYKSFYKSFNVLCDSVSRKKIIQVHVIKHKWEEPSLNM